MREGSRNGNTEHTETETEHTEKTEADPETKDPQTEPETGIDEQDAETADADTETADDQNETATTTVTSGGNDAAGDVSAPLPDAEVLDSALEDEGETGTTDEDTPASGLADVADTDEPAATEEETRVLEFTLDNERYCLNIEYIEEIVKEETITRVPNTPEFVRGVVDLRGQITTILNPKVTLEKENDNPDELIVVFDEEAFEDQGHIGWVVDDVREVSPIVESQVNDPPIEAEYINGVIDRDEDEEFVIWTSPNLAFEAD
jgi:purine-binding chemotaxis protein CheW